MRTCVQRLLVLAICAAALGFAGGSSANTGATETIILFPFPPFAGIGEIVVFPPIDDDPNGPGCTFWRDDSNGALYFFSGIDEFEVGDRVKVVGQVCNICLVYNVCGIPATPLLFVETTLIEAPGVKNKIGIGAMN